MSDIVDVSSTLNADIVNKCVNILKLMGEFVNSERKKVESAQSNEKKADESMEEQKNSDIQPIPQVVPDANNA